MLDNHFGILRVSDLNNSLVLVTIFLFDVLQIQRVLKETLTLHIGQVTLPSLVILIKELVNVLQSDFGPL